jgi:hypothetical protein
MGAITSQYFCRACGGADGVRLTAEGSVGSAYAAEQPLGPSPWVAPLPWSPMNMNGAHLLVNEVKEPFRSPSTPGGAQSVSLTIAPRESGPV